MSKTICSKCRYAVQDILEMFCMCRKLHTKDGLFKNCHCFSPKSVFHYITQSPEVLAEKLVVEYQHGVKDYAYYSTVTGGLYNTKEEAVAATVKALKEVKAE